MNNSSGGREFIVFIFYKPGSEKHHAKLHKTRDIMENHDDQHRERKS